MKKKKFTLSFLFLLAAEVIYSFSAYIIVAVLGRMLGPADYGRYALVTGVATMITILVARGVPTAMMKRISENQENHELIYAIRKTAIAIQTPIVIGLTVLYFLLTPLIAKILGDTTLIPLLRMSALIIPFFALSSFYVLYLNGLKSFKALAVIKSLRGITRIFAIVGFAYLFALEGSIFGAAIAPLILFMIAVFISSYIEPHKLKIPKENKIAAYPHKKLLSYAGGFILFLVLYEFYIRMDLYLIKSLIGDDATTGLYDAAVKIALLPFFAVYALTLMLFPTMSELAEKKDLAGIRKHLNTIGSILAVVLPLGAIVIYILRDFLMKLFFGGEFLPAADLIPYMLGATIFMTIFYILASVLNGAGHTRVTWSTLAISVTTGFILNLIYIPVHGATATAAIFSLTSIMMGLSSLFCAYRLFYMSSGKKI